MEVKYCDLHYSTSPVSTHYNIVCVCVCVLHDLGPHLELVKWEQIVNYISVSEVLVLDQLGQRSPPNTVI